MFFPCSEGQRIRAAFAWHCAAWEQRRAAVQSGKVAAQRVLLPSAAGSSRARDSLLTQRLQRQLVQILSFHELDWRLGFHV
eukprot:scaffold241_cov242-Pinguiococcus_pyrenoidosus.AAC.33